MVALVVFVLSPGRQVSDASYSLLVSESLLRHGTFALDAYVATPLDPAVHPVSTDGELPYQLMKSGGHFYYAYPPGTSILSVPYAATVTGWMAAFVATSWMQYGRFLPPYYRPTKLGTTEFLTGLTANLVSPSRGLIIFLPHLLVIGYLLIRYRRRSPLAPLAILGAGVALCHLVVVASFPIWWGGEGYGPRLMTDTVPWLIVIALAAIQGWGSAHSGRPSNTARFRVEAALVAVLSLAALGINEVGAWSAATNEWNWTPVSVDQDPSRVWGWRDAQFLAPCRDGSG